MDVDREGTPINRLVTIGDFSRDTLISNPPRSLTSDLGLIAWVDEVLDGILGRLLL